MISYALQSSAFDTSTVSAVAWSPDLGLFVAVGTGGVIATSPDGLTWTTRTTPFTGTVNATSVAWGQGLFIVGASGSGTAGGIATSPDGITWTLQSTPWNANPRVTAVAASPTLFVATRFAGTRRVMTSPDGVTWTQQTTPFDAQSIWAAGWSSELGLFLAGGDPGPEVLMTSPDGVTWTARSTPLDAGELAGVGNSSILGGAIAVGNDSTGGAVTLITSTDGVTWTARTTPFDGSGGLGRAVGDGGATLIVAAGQDPTGAVTIATSPDGITWTANASPFDSLGYADTVAYSPELELSVIAGHMVSSAVIGIGALAAIVLTAPIWTVEHYEHEYVPDGVHSLTLAVDGSLIQIVKPENLHFILQLGVLGPGQIDYEISIGALDDVGDPVVSPDFVGPYRTDFLLKRSDLAEPIMGGMHTPVSGIDSADTPIEAVQISGKDWLHYLEHRVWPYDATLSYIDWDGPPGVSTLGGLRFKISSGEVGEIVLAILETIRDISNLWPASPDPTTGPSYSLQFTTDIDSTGVTVNYEISNFDASSIYSLIQALAQGGKTRGGFDFYMTWDKTFKLVAPEIGDPMSPAFTLEVDATTHIPNMLSAGFTNDGPEATHVLGVGAGTSTQQGGINKHFPANSAVFRRLDKVADFGNLKNLDTLESLTSLELAFGSNPVHEIPIEVDPADIPNFWNLARPGVYITVVYDLGFHSINSTQRIISMDCTVDTEGNERVVLGFNQFYNASDHAGIGDV